MRYQNPWMSAAIGVGVAVAISMALLAMTPNRPGDNGGAAMAVGFCFLPMFALVGGGVGLFIGRRRVRRYFDDRPGTLPPRPRQRPYQRRDGSF